MKRLFSLLMVIVLFASCRTTTSKEGSLVPTVPVVAGSLEKNLVQLTFEGDNGEGYFSPDGAKLIFQSKLRPSHKNSQIYILDLKSKRERRINYNDGDDTCS